MFSEKKSEAISYGNNRLTLFYPDTDTGKYLDITQNKHHRWYLDESQILNYELEDIFVPDEKVKWWESSQTHTRELISYHDAKINFAR